MIGYSDADWGGDPTYRKSTSGLVFKVFGNTVVWNSRKQIATATSSTEAEYISLSNTASEGIWIMKILNDLNIKVTNLTIYEDNLSTIKSAEVPTQKRLKHIDIRYHHIKDLINNKKIRLEYIRSEEQEADMLTKPITGSKFSLNKFKLNVRRGVEYKEAGFD